MKSIFALAALSLAYGSPTLKAPEAKSDYIVVFKTNPQGARARMRFTNEALNGLETYQEYSFDKVSGFAASLTATQYDALSKESNVAYIEEDGFMQTQHVIRRTNPVIQETNTTWGLGRISHRQKGSTEYAYESSGGAGTCAYIIDTGLMTTHPEFEGRATLVKAFDTGDQTDFDMFGHGTHVAGTIGSKSYGVAKKASLYGIKVCNGMGMCKVSDVVAGIQLTIEDSAQRACPNGVIINMSLGSTASEWKFVKTAVKGATDAGIFVSVSAGNSYQDSAPWSPASAPSACTVGASDKDDGMAMFSNYGKPVALFAPGVDVLSTYSVNGSIGTDVMSGTSMASPHIAGLAAYIMGKDGRTAPDVLCKKLQDLSTKGVITSIPEKSNTVNYLAFNGVAV